MNKFVLVKANGEEIENPSISGLKIEFSGENNYVEVHEQSKFVNTHIRCSNGSRVVIKKSHPKGIRNCMFSASTDSKNNYILVDENICIASAHIYCQGTDNAGFVIGRDNMWSSDIVIRGSDGHEIYDLDSMDTINFSKETVIGDNVWVGSRATVMRGVTIPSGAIIGQDTIVTKSFPEENVVIAGNPGKIVRRNVGWNMDVVRDSEAVQKLDKNNEKDILPANQSSSYWEMLEKPDCHILSRIASNKNDKWIKFDLAESLCNGEQYYLVFEFESNCSTSFTFFLNDENQNIYRVPMFWVHKNVRRRIVHPFIPDVIGLQKISISASHFPDETVLKIYDFRIERVR